jgi:hypothetical protein
LIARLDEHPDEVGCPILAGAAKKAQALRQVADS